MSDRASLQIRDLTARIAELEAELAKRGRHAQALANAGKRIAELEAEVERLGEALRLKYGDSLLSVGEAYAFRSLPDFPKKKANP